jgi:hypothetical protein
MEYKIFVLMWILSIATDLYFKLIWMLRIINLVGEREGEQYRDCTYLKLTNKYIFYNRQISFESSVKRRAVCASTLQHRLYLP